MEGDKAESARETDAESDESETQISSTTRRKVLKYGSAVAGVSALAGCGQNDSGNGGNGGNGGGNGGQVVEIEYVTRNRSDSPENFVMFQEVISMWEELGIEVDHVALETAEKGARMRHEGDDFVVGDAQWSGAIERVDPLRYYYIYYGENESYNWVHADHPDYNEAYDKLSQSLDRTERQEAAYKCQEVVYEECWERNLVYPITKAGVNTDKWDDVNPRSIGQFPFANKQNLINASPKTDDTDWLHALAVSGVSTLNPFAMQRGFENLYSRLIFDRLIRPDDEGAPQGSSAESWEVVDDTTVDFTLRDGLVFSDGEPVTPEDVKFSWDVFKEFENPYFASHYSIPESVEITGDRGVRFNLSEPNAGFIGFAAYIMPILPKHVWDGVTEREGLDHPREWTNVDWTTSGPFKVAELNPPESFIFEANDNYHEDFNGLERFVFQKMGGQEQALGMLESGNASSTSFLLTDQLTRIKENSNGNWDHVEAVTTQSPSFIKVPFNKEMEFVGDIALRKAMAHAIDSERLVEVAFNGEGAVPSPQGNMTASYNEFWHNPDAAFYDGGIEKSREILEEAGYSWSDNGQLLAPE
jgi:peptide/nickel transport system substrate-binding protein